MLTAGLLSAMLTWWSGPLDTALGLKSGNSISFIRIGPVLFAARGIAPVGCAVFAFALGVTAAAHGYRSARFTAPDSTRCRAGHTPWLVAPGTQPS